MRIFTLTGIVAFFTSVSFVAAQNTGKDTTLAPIDDKLFERVEVEAAYPGGSAAWLKFLTRTVQGEVPTENNAPAGSYTVVIQFVVNKDSTISEFSALTKHGYGMEQEVIRALRLSGKWTPAVQNGRPVRAYRKQPVTFRVEMDNIDIETETPWALYLNKENTVTIKAYKVKDEDLLVTVSHGTITKNGGGQYTIKLSRKDRVIIRVYNTKKDRSEGEAIYDVLEKR